MTNPRYCVNCGATLGQQGAFCASCGRPVDRPAGSPSERTSDSHMTNCLHCNSEVQSGWKACPACGERLPEISDCPSCGAKLQQGWKACPTCGNRVDDQSQATELNINDEVVEEVNHRLSVDPSTQVDTGESRMVSFPRAVLLLFRNSFNFRGRSARAEIWWVWLFIAAATSPLLIVEDYMGWFVESGRYIGALTSLFDLAIAIPELSLIIRRLHDVNRSGWWLLTGIMVLIWAFKRGDDGPNKYGPDPRPPSSVTGEPSSTLYSYEANPRHKLWLTTGLLVIVVLRIIYGFFM